MINELAQHIRLPEIIPQDELAAWRENIAKVAVDKCPPEVVEFIDALAAKLDDFIRIKTEYVNTSGEDLLLGGVKEINGEPVNAWDTYPTLLPYMVAADHRAAMYRIFNRKGKQGLIDFCQVKVKGTELERTLQILNVIVFHQERSEFKTIMDDIRASQKLETKLDV